MGSGDWHRDPLRVPTPVGCRTKKAPGQRRHPGASIHQHREACSPWGRARAIMVLFGPKRKLWVRQGGRRM
jgi:hypothetical protein